MSHLATLQRARRELKVDVADFALLRLFLDDFQTLWRASSRLLRSYENWIEEDL